ncbi:MAG: hypothetical protein AAGB46_01505 [Verrucomicrobiota bacterium]
MKSYYRVDRELGVVKQLLLETFDLGGLARLLSEVQSDPNYRAGMSFIVDLTDCHIEGTAEELNRICEGIGRVLSSGSPKSAVLVDRPVIEALFLNCDCESGEGSGVKYFASKMEAMEYLGILQNVA